MQTKPSKVWNLRAKSLGSSGQLLKFTDEETETQRRYNLPKNPVVPDWHCNRDLLIIPCRVLSPPPSPLPRTAVH